MRRQKIYDQGGGHYNEDTFLIADKIFGVFDGATSLAGFLAKSQAGEPSVAAGFAETEKTGGVIASETARDTFAEYNGPLKDAGLVANARIREAMTRRGIDLNEKAALWGTSCAVICIRGEVAEFFQIGDSLLLVIDQSGRYNFPVPYVNHDIEILRAWNEWAEKRATDIRHRVNDIIVANRRQANIAYGVMNGELEAAQFVNVGTFSLVDVADIILFTDGLHIPKRDPNAPDEWDTFVALYRAGGLQGLLNHVRTLENEDPNCWDYPRLKPHDDIAAIAVSF